MSKDLLLEIGMEEIPARFIRGAMEQLQEKVTKWLTDWRIQFAEARPYATPRRIAVIISGVAEKQADLKEAVRGPSRKIAVDDSGAWTKAALGFARSQGVAADELYFEEMNGVEYVFAQKKSSGVAAADVLGEGLTEIITSMAFPKNMRWGAYDLKFVRPIRWIVALFGEDVISLEIAGVRAGRTTRGHRFLGREVELRRPSDYVDALREQYVFADISVRKQLILKQLNDLGAEKQWNISIKDDLLEEVLFLVEYPTVLYGTFNPQFLHIPQEVLITSMREHQRYFPVLGQDGSLLPYFVTVRNGNSASLDQVVKGNEKVLRARLSDAKFFYEEDQKIAIDSALAGLEKIVFHEQLGTLGDKVRRIRNIADKLAGILKADDATLKRVARAAAICKFDLVTQMVYEFPELQGVMGEDYARKAGEHEAVARAVFEHYQPRFSGDASPESLVGSIISIADKIDTIVGCFSIGIIPTGSQDPYALRRQAAGIVQIILEHGLKCTLSEIFNTAVKTHQKAGLMRREAEDVEKDLADFFALRVRNVLTERDIRYDVVDAVMAGGFDHIPSVVGRGEALMANVTQPQFKSAADSFNRVNNLAAKATSEEIERELFAEPAEQELFETWTEIHRIYEEQMKSGRAAEALQTLGGLKDAINRFFDSVMVMAEDQRIRKNRLSLLHRISSDLKAYADFQKIVW